MQSISQNSELVMVELRSLLDGKQLIFASDTLRVSQHMMQKYEAFKLGSKTCQSSNVVVSPNNKKIFVLICNAKDKFFEVWDLTSGGPTPLTLFHGSTVGRCGL